MPGTLVLCVPPLAVVRGRGASVPHPHLLVDHILATHVDEDPWFGMLYTGCQETMLPSTPPPVTPRVSSVDRQRAEEEKLSSTGRRRRSRRPVGLRGRKVAKAVKYNAYGDHDDVVLAAFRQEAVESYVGLWPWFSLLNHSCAPNAVNYLVGSQMYVRCVRHIPAGQEVTISYLGRPQLKLLSTRHHHLQEQFGFKCSCQRCQLEEQCYGRMEGTLEDIQEEVETRLRPLYVQAKSHDDRKRLSVVVHDLRHLSNQLLGTFRRALISPRARLFFMASVYDLYDLMADCMAALGAHDMELVQLVLPSLKEVTCGSDLHTSWAAHYLRQAEKLEDMTVLDKAREECRQAHCARYGELEDPVYKEVVELSARSF